VRGTKNESAGHQRMQARILSGLQNDWDWREPKSRSPFFRSLLGSKDGVYAENRD
jgi:hypothetical protein